LSGEQGRSARRSGQVSSQLRARSSRRRNLPRGSYAAGTATDTSDIDIYLVTAEHYYQTFFSRREAFMRRWGEPVRPPDILNFERLGFDMFDFELTDGVRGQLAMGHTGNFMVLHGATPGAP
jgi:Nucleotidyltransferase domain